MHLLAINDGRLLEWIEGVESRRGGNGNAAHKGALRSSRGRSCRSQNPTSGSSASTNGRLSEASQQIESESRPSFLERLLDHLYGVSKPPRSGRLANHVRRKIVVKSSGRRGSSVRTDFPVWQHKEIRSRARQRLFEALQAVHLRGETHITVRELRAALSLYPLRCSFLPGLSW